MDLGLAACIEHLLVKPEQLANTSEPLSHTEAGVLLCNDILSSMSEEVEEFDQKRADQLIQRYIGRRSVREIAEMAGMRPEEVMRRKTELINNIDVLTIQEKRAKLLYELDELAANARERADSSSDEFFSGMLNSSVSAMKTVLVELARAEKADQGAVEQLNNLRVKELLRLMDSVVLSSVREIADRFDLDEDELTEIFQERLVDEARMLEDQTN